MEIIVSTRVLNARALYLIGTFVKLDSMSYSGYLDFYLRAFIKSLPLSNVAKLLILKGRPVILTLKSREFLPKA